MGEKIIIRVKPEIFDLVPGYITHRKKDLADIKVFISQDRFDEIRAIGHKMKGVGKLYNMDQVTDMGDKLERAAVEKDKKSITEALAVLEDYFERVEVVV